MIDIVNFDNIDHNLSKSEIKIDKYLIWTQADYHYAIECNKNLSVIKNGTKLTITIPQTYTSNGANIPFFIQGILDPIDKKWGVAAFYHDFLYSKESKAYGLSRLEADMILYKIMEQTGSNLLTRSLFFISVRLFGWSFYEN